MAKVLKELPNDYSSSPWDKFTDGQVWQITLGVDVQARSHSRARSAFSQRSIRHGKIGRYRKLTDTTAAVQAVPKEVK